MKFTPLIFQGNLLYNATSKLFFQIKQNVTECGNQFFYTEEGLYLYENRN